MSYYTDYNNNWEKNHFSKRDYSLIYKYSKFAKNALDENEIYDVIKKNNYNEEKIIKDIKERAKIIEEKGDDYGWKEVKKGKIIKEEIRYNNKSKNKNKIYGKKNYNKNYIKEENLEKKNNKNEHRNYRNYNSNDFYHYVSKQPKRPFQECIEVPSDYNPNLIKKNNIENTSEQIIEENKMENSPIRNFEENKIEDTPGKDIEEIKETEYKTPSPENKINLNNNIQVNSEEKKDNENNIAIIEKEDKKNNNAINKNEEKIENINNSEIIKLENNNENIIIEEKKEKENEKENKNNDIENNCIEEKKEIEDEKIVNINEIIKEESINEEKENNNSKNNQNVQLTLSEDSIKSENNNSEEEEIDEEREWRETNLRVYLDKLKNYSMTVEKTKKNNLSNKVFSKGTLFENNRYEKNNLTIQSNNLNIESSNNIFIPSKYNTPFRDNFLKIINERKKIANNNNKQDYEILYPMIPFFSQYYNQFNPFNLEINKKK